MNSESSNFQQKGKRKKNPNYINGPYPQKKPYKKVAKSKQYGSPGSADGHYRPRFQSDEGYSYNDSTGYGEFYHTPPQNSTLYGFQDQTQRINQNITAFSSGFKHQKKFRSAIPNAGNLRPHKLNYCEDNYSYNQFQFNNYSESFPTNLQYSQGPSMQFHGSKSTNNFLRFHQHLNSVDPSAKNSEYDFNDYFRDLLSVVVCLNADFEAQRPILDYLGISPKQCKDKYSVMVEELRLNFNSVQNETIGGPDKILIMMLEKLAALLKKFPKEVTEYLPFMIESSVNLIEASLEDPTGIDQNITISDGSDVKCLKAMLESIKAKELNETLTQKCFCTLYKLLFIGTPHEHYVTQCKCKNVGGIDTDEEEKSYAKYKANARPFRASMFNPEFYKSGKAPTRSRTSSDPSSTECGNCGNKYKTAILSRLKPLTLNCISQLCQLNSKYLVEYYSMIFPKFQNKPIDKELQKTSIFYFISSDRRNKNIKEAVYSTSYYFLNASGFEKYLLESSLETVSSGKNIPDLSPRSHIKLPKDSEFSASKTTDDFEHEKAKTKDGCRFIERLHYLFYYLLSNETNHQVQCSILKLLSVLIQKSPYTKLKSELVSETVLPLVQCSFNSQALNTQRHSKVDQHVTCVIKDILSVRELRHELKNKFLAYNNIVKNNEIFEALLDLNETNIEALEMLGRNYPEMLTQNWPSLKIFLQNVFKQQDQKLKLGSLKMIEEWLNNFSKEYSSDSRSRTSDFDDKNTKESSSSSSISKMSEEEEKLSEDGLVLDHQKVDMSTPISQQIEVKDISPFKYDDFCEYLNNIFAYFLNESYGEKDNEFPTNNSQNNENKGVFLTMRIVTAMNVLYHRKFHQNIELIPDIILKLYEARNDPNTQVCMKNSWIVANICCSCDLNQLEKEQCAQLLAMAIMYNKSNKDKILSNSSRALGYIISRSNEQTLKDMFELLNSSEELLNCAYFGLNSSNNSNFEEEPVSVNTVIKVLVDKMLNTRPKIAWNSCVSLGHIIEQEHVRKFDCDALFSDQCFESFISILNDRPNYKVKIHVSQTLAKYKSYEEYNSKFFEVLYQCLVTMKDLFGESEHLVYKYIENLHISLIDLYHHLLSCLETTDEPEKKCQEFLTKHHDFIKDVFITYMKNRLSPPPVITSPNTSAADEDTANDYAKNLINTDSELRETLTKIQKCFQIMKKLIDDNDGTKIRFPTYLVFQSIEQTDVEDFGQI